MVFYEELASYVNVYLYPILNDLFTSFELNCIVYNHM